MAAPLPLNDQLRELLYLLLVKSSTIRVLPGMSGEPCLEGELQISTMLGRHVDERYLFDLTDNSSYTCNLKAFKSRGYDEDSRGYFYKVCRLRECYPQDYDFWDTFVQIDIYCSEGDDILLDEAAYVRDAFKKLYRKNELLLDKFRIFLFCFSDTRDYSGYSRVAPSGFNKVSFDIYLVIGVLKD